MKLSKLLAGMVLLFLPIAGWADEPEAQLPQTYIDTTWNPPAGGTTWPVHNSSDFTHALAASNPGDTIVLDAGITFPGNFILPRKPNPSGAWIYVESSQLSRLPGPGRRVSPNNAPNMPIITTSNATAPITIAAGADHWRLVGLDVTSRSTTHWCDGCNNFSYSLINTDQAYGGLPISTDSITVDRCYLHGTPTQDVREGVAANAINMAVIDSYISDIHQSTMDSQAIIAYYTPGPLKIVDDYLSATTEDVMFGGAGGYNDPYVPSDIEIRNNLFFKPLSWLACGIGGTVAPGEELPNGTVCPPSPSNQWVEKNNLEFKSAQRVIVTGNVMQNTWVSGQTGSSVLLTVRTGQSGNVAVVDDITFENNAFNNVYQGFSMIETDDTCVPQDYPNCTNPGESKRVIIKDNLLLMRPSSDGAHHWGFSIGPDLTDYVIQHNTVMMTDRSTCGGPTWFNSNQDWGWPPPQSYTHNLWFLDNAFCRQPSGDNGGQGTTGLTYYMGDPAPLAPRYLGNVMFVPRGDTVQSFPPRNLSTQTALGFSPQWLLLSPVWASGKTSDGLQAGDDMTPSVPASARGQFP